MSKRFIFVTSGMRGAYTSMTPDNEAIEYLGVALYLGVGRGVDVHEAWENLVGRHGLAKELPDLKHSKIWGYEALGEGLDVSPNIDDVSAKHEGRESEISGTGYGEKTCIWCSEAISSNGAAQFAHLKKHVTQLVKAKLLEPAQVMTIRSIKLSPEMEAIFKQGQDQKVFK